MKVISIKLKENIFKDVETLAKQCHVSRNTYISNALDFYNKNCKSKWRDKLRRASKLVGKDSLDFLKEIEGIDPHLID
jgi:hypothetical protein